MIIKEGYLNYRSPWTDPDVYIFTGNSYITAKSKLVMGRGAALECRGAYPGCDAKLASVIQAKAEKTVIGEIAPDYGLVFIEIGPTFMGISGEHAQYLGVFQVKRYYSDPANLDLITHSTNILKQLAENKPHLTFHMNFPGIGAGGLKYEFVLPSVQCLPDNVILYK